MKTNHILNVISALLILLFVYTAMSKLLDFEQFKSQMYNQTLPHEMATALIWTLPEIEILTTMLLLFERTRSLGFYLSGILMVLFTGYIGLVLLNYFGRVPCACGGVIKALGWKMHLMFNLFFLLLTGLGIFIDYRERRTTGKVN
jgi:putative oxidoreductase